MFALKFNWSHPHASSIPIFGIRHCSVSIGDVARNDMVKKCLRVKLFLVSCSNFLWGTTLTSQWSHGHIRKTILSKLDLIKFTITITIVQCLFIFNANIIDSYEPVTNTWNIEKWLKKKCWKISYWYAQKFAAVIRFLASLIRYSIYIWHRRVRPIRILSSCFSSNTRLYYIKRLHAPRGTRI